MCASHADGYMIPKKATLKAESRLAPHSMTYRKNGYALHAA